jgi:transposase
MEWIGVRLLFVGNDWAEEHHDVELQDEAGRVLTRAKLPEGVAGMARLHAMIGEHLGDDVDEAEVVVGIETDRGPWVQALIAAGYQVHAINPLQVARYRERYSVSGGKSDPGDAHVLADMVRTDRHQLRPVAGDSVQAEAVKVLTRAHKTLIFRTHPPPAAAAQRPARVLPGRFGRLRRPQRRRRAGAPGQRPGPDLGRRAEHRGDRDGAHAGPSP